MFVKSIAAVAAFASFSLVAAQNTTFDPSVIDPTTRAQWCQGQQNTCGALCGGDVTADTCDVNSLSYNCTCTSNGSTPGLQYYTQTIPTFICEEVFKECNAAGVGDAAAQALCAKNEVNNCGHLTPPNVTSNAVTTTTSAGSTATSAAASGASSTSSSKAAGATMAPMQQFGTGAMAVGIAAAFGYML